MIAQPNGHRRLFQTLRGLGLGAVILLDVALSAASPAHAFQFFSGAPPAADALLPAAGAAPTRYADRGYDPIGREIERLEPAPPPGSCEEDPYIERRRVIPDSSGLCGIRCWYWRLRHGYCGPGCEYYRYWAHERNAPPGLRHPRHACKH
jgi:hypothetical protein